MKDLQHFDLENTLTEYVLLKHKAPIPSMGKKSKMSKQLPWSSQYS